MIMNNNTSNWKARKERREEKRNPTRNDKRKKELNERKKLPTRIIKITLRHTIPKKSETHATSNLIKSHSKRN